MNSIRHSLQRLSLNNKPFLNELIGTLRRSIVSSSKLYSDNETFNTEDLQSDDEKKYSFLDYNKTFFPIQSPDEERRPAYVCHMKANIKYSLKKMWYIASFVRGMTVDEAVKQLSFMHKKGAMIVKETILEAQELAVLQHNVEFKSNLWVAESFTTKGIVVKGIRRHARARIGEIRYMYVHYFVRLEEGKPPKNYYLPVPKTGEQQIEKWLKEMRMRKIYNSL
ncbi:PREDICTED: 39S ribosomal protein L22, mitochondrial [Polistes dominula]|uniref:Large ribosomal subunit protein uL22m n=1 Tax=Polistes dominula TaxID=743375 RepID=A0ABM1I791_POLDO|nr:PREDICTED: 39S ribosomal protein L22, mitochondrial [Polistes dominula]